MIMSFAFLLAAAQKSNYMAADDLFDSPLWSETLSIVSHSPPLNAAFAFNWIPKYLANGYTRAFVR